MIEDFYQWMNWNLFIPFWFNLLAKTIILTCYSVKVLAQWIIFLTFPLPHCLKTEYKIGWFFMLGACWLVGGMYPLSSVTYENISCVTTEYLETTLIVVRDFMQDITRFLLVILFCKVTTKWMIDVLTDHVSYVCGNIKKCSCMHRKQQDIRSNASKPDFYV